LGSAVQLIASLLGFVSFSFIAGMAFMDEEEAGVEWMSILEEGQEEVDEAKAAGKVAADMGLEADADAMEEEDLQEVADEGDATALLASVKERLGKTGRSKEYHEFLTAISSSAVDVEAALAIIAGHDDLVASFQRCFGSAPSMDSLPTDDKMDVRDAPPADRRGAGARASQLVNLVFTNKVGHLPERAKMLEYVKTKAAKAAFPRRLFVVRGLPASGKSTWAMQSLGKEAPFAKGDSLAAKLAHVCSVDDFFSHFESAGSSEMRYIFNPQKLDTNQIANEARVRLAMELGLEPLYVDNSCMHLWEMRPYVLLADRFGYVVTVVEPQEVNPHWKDIDFLVARNEAESRRNTDKFVGRPALEAMLGSFEALPEGDDPRPPIRAAEKPPPDDDGSAPAAGGAALLVPSAMLYKLEKLMAEGTSLLRYTPPDGAGWGVNGELDGDWHSFREKADGSCTYEDSKHWRTEDPETAWTFEGLTWLEDMHKQADQLPEASLPTAFSHPSLFVQQDSNGKKRAPPPVAPRKEAPAPPPVSKKLPPIQYEADLPSSRRERYKQRAMREARQAAEELEEAPEPPPKKPRSAPTLNMPTPRQKQAGAAIDADDFPDMPTEQEEMSAATFLAAVKTRLMDWGKVEQYHEFVVALSGSVDAKAAVRILRGHDDLLKVFKRKFAPRADLMQIKEELREEDPTPSDGPVPPPMPPPGGPPRKGMVKKELGAEPPKAPAFRGIKKEIVKKEIVKSEVNPEDMPRPPSYNPHGPRPVVTVGDDDEDEDDFREDLIAEAVKKGRDECIAQLAKILFRKERASREGVRQRFDMVRYATRRAARPRFPRECFILRGAPGTGKTEYAMAKLSEAVDIEPDETLAGRLTHVCATDDFFEMFKGDGAQYKFEAHKLEAYVRRNVARVRLTMEAGIHPIFIDEPNMRLWEMTPYIELANKLGYVVHVVDPSEACERWDDIDWLTSMTDTQERRDLGKVVPKGMLKAFVEAFEPMPNVSDPVDTILTMEDQGGSRIIQASGTPVTQPKGSAGRPIPSKSKVKAELWR